MLFIRRPLKLHSFNKQKTFLLPLEWAWVRRTANETKADLQDVRIPIVNGWRKFKKFLIFHNAANITVHCTRNPSLYQHLNQPKISNVKVFAF